MKRATILFMIILGTALVCLVAPLFGTKSLWSMLLGDAEQGAAAWDILWSIRLPRTILAFLAGCALAVSGLTFQAIFRNPLATPFTLGISSGASFGATAFIRFGLPLSLQGGLGAAFFAFLGAVLSVFVVYGLTRFKNAHSTASMLLAGVAVSYCFSSLILLMQYTADFHHSFQIVRWLMGGLEVVGYGRVITIAPFVFIGCLILLTFSHELNLMAAGEDLAVSRGVNVKRVIIGAFLVTSLMIGAVVSVCGPIGFIGMMVPHICRLLLGWDHRVLLPATIAFGGGFLVLCDTVSRTVFSPVEIPVGVITAMLGGPFFLWLLAGGSAERAYQKGQ